MLSSTIGRRLAGTALAGALAVSLAACGSSNTPAATAPASGQQAQAATAAFPVTIEHKFGKTEIKAEPKRVVALGLTDHDAMVALGVKPVGATDWFGERPFANWPWIDSKWGDARPEVISDGAEVQFEKIAALRPDLIIGQYAQVTQEQYDKLSKIAPTVAQNGKYEDYSTPWREMTLTIGKALGKQAQTQQLLSDLDAKFAQIRKDHPEFAGKKIVVGDSPAQGQYGAFAPADPRTQLIAGLGFTVDPKLDGQTKEGKPVTFGDERLDLLDTDVLIMMPSKPTDVDRIKQTPVFANLAVAKADKVIYLPYSNPPTGAALTFATVLSIPWVLDQMVPALSQAAKKQ
ncbi:iron-siderophore ABC transporter substrate-binding protein [Kibdelosporangium aridum]|uniref:Iron-siderophore ABC transporter substrate-binding protein n=1 Tax=Kibdelosporangium aridum TaxID=2030 RepID=A0A428ZNF1_KIBAR|nr:iron-siderophore ABC transporter substrate-binding protein [Kibdelosporangium aridum]RSM89584.1 iron-siderophore ABC transporter substrate-binding protein [Kibdelosporangium aridum]